MEVGKIKLEDVLTIVKLAHRVHMETEHYVGINFSNWGHGVMIYVMEGGFNSKKKYSFAEYFSFYDPYSEERDIRTYCKIKDYLKGLLSDKNV